MWRSVLLMLLVGAMAFSQEENKVYPSESAPLTAGITPVPNVPEVLVDAVNYWKMEESGTDDRLDSIETDDLTPDVPQDTIAGKNNLALNCDANTESLVNTTWRAVGWTGVSFSVWLRRSGYVTEVSAVVMAENINSFPAFFIIAHNAGGYIQMSLRDSTNAIQTVVMNTQDAGYTSGWIHFVGSWTSGGAPKIYIDGALLATAGGTLNGATLKDSDAGIVIGSSFGVGNPWYGGNDGYIDEVAIFDFDIGLEGAQAMYAAGEGKFWP